MAEAFDPYHKWLGIPPEDQPPDHYRLLGLKALESDRDAIESAADQRMAHLRTYQSGKQSGLSQAMLNEVAAAKICLLSPAKKAAYDAQLRKKLATSAAAAVEGQAGFDLDSLLGQPVSGPLQHSHPKAEAAKGLSKQVWILAAAGATTGLLVLIVVAAVLYSGNSKEPAQSAKSVASPQPIVPSPSKASSERPEVAAKRPEVTAQPPEVSTQPKFTATITPPAEDMKPSVTVLPAAPPQPKDISTPDSSGGRGPAQTLPTDSKTDAPQATVTIEQGQAEPKSIADPTISASGEKPARVPAPNAETQKESLATLQEIYHFDRVTTPAAQVNLAKEMLKLAENSKGKPDEQFAVLRKAAELACDAGDVDLMLRVVDSIAASFEVDAIAMKGKLLARLAENAKDAAGIKGFIQAADQIISQDLAEDRYEAAEAVSALAERITQKPLAKSFRKEVHDRHLQIQQLHKEWQPVQAALETLESHPDDADANLAAGRWHCLNKGDWEKGLPYLAKGGDSELCQTAKADVKSPEGAEAQLKLADTWWDLAAKAHGAEQNALRLRAGYWYKQLLSEANGGLVRLKIQKRLDQIEQIGRPLPGVPAGRSKRAVVNSIGMKFMLIPPGEFMMGSPDSDRAARPDEKPQHRVRITRRFYMGVCEVTQGNVRQVMGTVGRNNPLAVGQDSNQLPTVDPSWLNAVEFCMRLSQFPRERTAGRTYRLPTEAEWEYACRAGTTTNWHFGDDPAAGAAYSWFGENAGGMPHLVGQKRPNAWGLCDMHGNAAEWCADWYDRDYYRISPVIDPQGPSSGTQRVKRGGTASYQADDTRAARREAMVPQYRGGWVGFRVVMVPAR